MKSVENAQIPSYAFSVAHHDIDQLVGIAQLYYNVYRWLIQKVVWGWRLLGMPDWMLPSVGSNDLPYHSRDQIRLNFLTGARQSKKIPRVPHHTLLWLFLAI